ncbi:hypothetical protein [Campylobacter mucosalis]|uniref:hypothetical protein n=1 Tax=Campylobacter mucosalis TaxID=202 RepID=UPI0014702491|nr:hypothetical protein [Campylobacter mucosalis]
MRNIIKILFMGFGLLLVGCSPKTPDCSADDTKELVFKIVKDEIAKFFNSSSFKQMQQMGVGGANELKISDLTYKLEEIRTKSHDKELDKYRCVAKLITTNKKNGETKKSNIEYVSERTDDNMHYVTVYGL